LLLLLLLPLVAEDEPPDVVGVAEDRVSAPLPPVLLAPEAGVADASLLSTVWEDAPETTSV
jgi:hypothetical protein